MMEQKKEEVMMSMDVYMPNRMTEALLKAGGPKLPRLLQLPYGTKEWRFPLVSPELNLRWGFQTLDVRDYNYYMGYDPFDYMRAFVHTSDFGNRSWFVPDNDPRWKE